MCVIMGYGLWVMGLFMPARQWEVSRNKILPATFVLTDTPWPPFTVVITVMDCLLVYQDANQDESIPYPFIVSLRRASRFRALSLVNDLFREIKYQQDVNDLCYAIDWWWRTPSNAGTSELRIGFRLRGLYEMV